MIETPELATITNYEFDLLRYTIGYKVIPKMDRNFFNTGKGHIHYDAIKELEKKGFMKRRHRNPSYENEQYKATEKGIDAIYYNEIFYMNS